MSIVYNVETKFDFSGVPTVTTNDDVKDETLIGIFPTKFKKGVKEIKVYGAKKTGINSYEVPKGKHIFYKDFDNALFPGYGAGEIQVLLESIEFMKIQSIMNPDNWLESKDFEKCLEITDFVKNFDVYDVATKFADIIIRPGWKEFVKNHQDAEFIWWTNKGCLEKQAFSINKNGRINMDIMKYSGLPHHSSTAIDALTRAEEIITNQPHRDAIIGYPNTIKNVVERTVSDLIKRYQDNPEEAPTDVVALIFDDTEFTNGRFHAGSNNQPLIKLNKYTHLVRDHILDQKFLELTEKIFPIRYMEFISRCQTEWVKPLFRMLSDDVHGPLIKCSHQSVMKNDFHQFQIINTKKQVPV